MTMHEDKLTRKENEEVPTVTLAAAPVELDPTVGKPPTLLEPKPTTETSHQSNQSDFGSSINQFISSNPGPSLLIGTGLAWLFVNRERSKSQALHTRMRERASVAKDTTGAGLKSAADITTEKVSEARSVTAEKLRSAGDVAKTRYQNVREENPLALGACALAVGLAVGLLLPSTRREDELMGEHRDTLMEQAQNIVHEARDAAVETLKSSKGDVQQRLEETREEMKDAVDTSVREAKIAAKEEYQSEPSS